MPIRITTFVAVFVVASTLFGCSGTKQVASQDEYFDPVLTAEAPADTAL